MALRGLFRILSLASAPLGCRLVSFLGVGGFLFLFSDSGFMKRDVRVNSSCHIRKFL